MCSHSELLKSQAGSTNARERRPSSESSYRFSSLLIDVPIVAALSFFWRFVPVASSSFLESRRRLIAALVRTPAPTQSPPPTVSEPPTPAPTESVGRRSRAFVPGSSG